MSPTLEILVIVCPVNISSLEVSLLVAMVRKCSHIKSKISMEISTADGPVRIPSSETRVLAKWEDGGLYIV